MLPRASKKSISFSSVNYHTTVKYWVQIHMKSSASNRCVSKVSWSSDLDHLAKQIWNWLLSDRLICGWISYCLTWWMDKLLPCLLDGWMTALTVGWTDDCLTLWMDDWLSHPVDGWATALPGGWMRDCLTWWMDKGLSYLLDEWVTALPSEWISDFFIWWMWMDDWLR